MDFTLALYYKLLVSLQEQDFTFAKLEENPFTKPGKKLVLRHDVDSLPSNSLALASFEQALGITGTYYFRIVPQSNVPVIIQKIIELGHEIGYHYEDLSSSKGDIDKAYNSFQTNLEYFRKFYPVKTICMHGSPKSEWDSRKIWDKYDYKKLGIIAEPYFDIDFSKVLYLTDTGRRWNGEQFSRRDKVLDPEARAFQSKYQFHYTSDIIKAVKSGNFPEKAMITIHPQRWTNNPLLWTKELVWQNVKNVVKRYFFVKD